MQWIKNNQPFSGVLVWNGRRIFNPSQAELLAAGYRFENIPESEPTATPRRYSSLKIIRRLGENWSEWRSRLDARGLLDQFLAANYLSDDDPVMAAFLAELAPEELAQLSRCETDGE